MLRGDCRWGPWRRLGPWGWKGDELEIYLGTEEQGLDYCLPGRGKKGVEAKTNSISNWVLTKKINSERTFII